jgi:preprotein translocase subunit SecB
MGRTSGRIVQFTIRRIVVRELQFQNNTAPVTDMGLRIRPCSYLQRIRTREN